MTENKATPEQWAADRYDWARADTEALDGNSAFRCILELRDRVEALESAQRAIASPSSNRTHLGLTQNAPESSDLLVERVADAIHRNGTGDGWLEEARAAILAVADWSEQQGLRTAADWLRQEVNQ